MPSNARKNLEANLKDVERLQGLHATVGGHSKGRRWNVECLNKASLVLVCGAWEAYLEDVCQEGLKHLIVYNAPGGLSMTAQGIRNNFIAANPGATQQQILGQLSEQLWVENKFNTPKSANIVSLFNRVFGLPDVTTPWYWQKSSVAQTRNRIDTYVSLRGQIAHRSSANNYVRKPVVTAFSELVLDLSTKVDDSVRAHVNGMTPGTPIF